MLDYILLALVLLVGLGVLTVLEHARYVAKFDEKPVYFGRHTKEDNES